MHSPATRIFLSAAERKQFRRLIRVEYAWTIDEAVHRLGVDRLRELIEAQILGTAPTTLGTLIVMRSRGRKRIIKEPDYPSPDAQLDRAYRRLIAQELGWSEITDDALKAQIQACSPGEHLLAMHTDDGPALVAAKLSGKGYSAEHIRLLARKLKSSALGDQFNVVIVTPGRRGMRFCNSRDHYMQWFHVRPDVGTTVLPWITESPLACSPDGPYLAGESWRSDPRFDGLREFTLQLLQQPRAERVTAALGALRLDTVLTDALLLRYYGLKPGDIPDVIRVERLARLTPSQRTRERNITFLTLSKRLENLHTTRLAHLAGSAELRHRFAGLLKLENYRLVTSGGKKHEQPDAIYTRDDGQEFAFEYDSGAYDDLTIWRKIDSFQTQGMITFWGVASPKRYANLTAKFEEHPNVKFVLINWSCSSV